MTERFTHKDCKFHSDLRGGVIYSPLTKNVYILPPPSKKGHCIRKEINLINDKICSYFERG